MKRGINQSALYGIQFHVPTAWAGCAIVKSTPLYTETLLRRHLIPTKTFPRKFKILTLSAITWFNEIISHVKIAEIHILPPENSIYLINEINKDKHLPQWVSNLREIKLSEFKNEKVLRASLVRFGGSAVAFLFKSICRGNFHKFQAELFLTAGIAANLLKHSWSGGRRLVICL